MAQHRTRKDKEKAQKLRLKEVEKPEKSSDVQHTYSFTNGGAGTVDKQVSTLLKVDSSYILKDLLKTVTISSILLMVVIGIYFYLRYN